MNFKLAVLFIFYLICCPPCNSQPSEINNDNNDYFDYEEIENEYNAPGDTSLLSIKQFSKSKVSELKADPDFKYKEPPTVAESLWDRFVKWLGQMISALLNSATATNWGRVLVYVASFTGFVIILMMIFKVNAFKLFYGNTDQGTVSTSGFHENIHELDFDKLILEAINSQKYREGIRLLFLHALKVLTDKHYIHWQAGKTNHDYVNELDSGDLKVHLNELSFYFDYAWYGNFPVKEEVFNKAKQLFHSLNHKTSH